MDLPCPHCKNPTESANVGPEAEITCTACGSNFRLDAGAATAFNGVAGATVGRFTLLETVGQGAFGTVFKARDPKLDRAVAVKVPRRSHVGDRPQDLDRFLREARSAAQLRHPCIVAVHEVGLHEGSPFLVSDFVPGVTLSDLFTARRPAPREAARLVADVADALDHAHRQGVVHRDVKPSNIMVRPDGSPVVMDFGLARRDSGEVTVTLDGQILGTPAYMSPEQARGEGHRVDGRSDLYSLGVVLYQLLTGELPFRGNTRMLLHQVVHDEPKPPRTLNDKLPRDLETVCLKAMAREPGRRYPTAGEFAADLRRFLAGEPVRARPVGRAEKAWRWARRRPAVAALSLALLVGGLTALVVTTVLWRQAVTAESEAEARARGESTARDKEARARHQADDERARVLERLYQRNVVLADQRWHEGNGPAAEALLDECPELLRGWEWRHLKARCRAADDAVIARESVPLGAIAYAPGGTQLAIGVGRGVHLRDGETVRPLDGMKYIVRDLAFDPSGRTLVAVALESATLGGPVAGEMIVWDLPTGAVRHRLTGWNAVAHGPEGLLYTGGGGPTVEVYDAADGLHIQTLRGHGASVSAVAASPRGGWVASGDVNGSVLLWRVGSGGLPVRVAGLTAGLADRGGGWAAFASWAEPVVQPARPVALTTTARSNVHYLAFSPDGTRLAAALSDGVLRVWEVDTGRLVLASATHSEQLHGVAWSPGGNLLATAGGNGVVRLCDPLTGRVVRTFPGHAGPANAVAFHPTGRHLVSAGQDRTARRWNPDERPGSIVLGRLPRPAQAVVPLGGGRVASACEDGGVRLHAADGSERLLGKHGGRALRLAWHPDAGLASGGQNGSLGLWDVETGKVRWLERATGMVLALAFAADGRSLVSGHGDGEVRVWNVGEGRWQALPRAGTPVLGVAIVGDRVWAVPMEGGLRAWRALAGEAPAAADVGPGVSGRNMALAATTDGRWVVTGGATPELAGVTRLWDGETARLVREWVGPAAIVGAVTFAADGSRLAIAAWDGTVRLYDPAAGNELLRLAAHDGSVYSVAFTPDGDLVSGGHDGVVRLHRAK